MHDTTANGQSQADSDNVRATLNGYSHFAEVAALRELMDVPQWVGYSTATGTKVPLDPATLDASYKAKSNKKCTWSTFRLAAQMAHAGTNGAVGVGFELGENSATRVYVFVDYDHCIAEDGTLESWVAQDIARLNSYLCRHAARRDPGSSLATAHVE